MEYIELLHIHELYTFYGSLKINFILYLWEGLSYELSGGHGVLFVEFLI